jgi:hypothetical protein
MKSNEQSGQSSSPSTSGAAAAKEGPTTTKRGSAQFVHHGAMRTVTPARLYECPKCGEKKGNKDVSQLKIHLFKHYTSYWQKEVGNDCYCT